MNEKAANELQLLTKLPEEEVKKAKTEEKKDNPTLGVIFFTLSGITFALNFIFAKVIYVNKPQTSALQVLVYRSIMSTAIMIIMINKNLKHVMWDSIPRDKWYPVWARVIQG